MSVEHIEAYARENLRHIVEHINKLNTYYNTIIPKNNTSIDYTPIEDLKLLSSDEATATTQARKDEAGRGFGEDWIKHRVEVILTKQKAPVAEPPKPAEKAEPALVAQAADVPQIKSSWLRWGGRGYKTQTTGTKRRNTKRRSTKRRR